MTDMADILRAAPIVPVLVIEDVDTAIPLAEALIEGGLPVLEITLRTAAAMSAIERICARLPEARVGAGTLTRPEEFARLLDAGADFAISPGATPRLYEAAAHSKLPFLPGVATASELMRGIEYGYACFKLFPAQSIGGPALLKSWHGPFADARFCPTGGINESNLADYLSLSNVITVGGSWFAPTADLAAGDWPAITRRARAAVETVAALRARA